ncbi:integration host factor, actinobacterial type, partial [Streptosporangium sandarakinum]
MALPKLTPEQRQAALAKAAETRAARAKLLADVKAGSVSLEQLLGRDDEVAKRIKVSQALRALPGIGNVKAAQLIAVTITAAIALLVYAVSEAPLVGWGSGQTIGM